MTNKTILHLLLIMIVGFASYANTFNMSFQFDDLAIISDNPFIKNIDNFVTPFKNHQYHPSDEYNSRRYLGYLSLALNYWWGGLEVTGYHVVNLFIHLVNGILVYFFVILTFRTPYFRREALDVKRETSGTLDLESTTHSQFTIHDSQFIALFSALLFVAHPVQTQAVTYIQY